MKHKTKKKKQEKPTQTLFLICNSFLLEALQCRADWVTLAQSHVRLFRSNYIIKEKWHPDFKHIFKTLLAYLNKEVIVLRQFYLFC